MSERSAEVRDPETVSIVIPVFNEETTLPELIHRCVAACAEIGEFEVVLVDDGSRDRSREIIERAAESHAGRVVGVFLNRNYGQHSAVTAGFQSARGDAVVTLDADLQNMPEDIPRIVDALRQGYDVVGSVRTPRRDRGFRKIASWIINRITAKTTGVRMTDYGCMLRGYRRHIVDAILACHEHSTFIPVLANGFARRTTEIPVGHAERASGDSKYGLWKLVNLQFDLLTSMTTLPLRLLTVIGGSIATLGVLFGLLILVLRLIHGADWAAQGVFTLMAVLFGLVGVQLFGMGLMGEYLGRVYDDVRARPKFFIDATIGRSAIGTRVTRAPDGPPRETDRASVGLADRVRTAGSAR